MADPRIECPTCKCRSTTRWIRLFYYCTNCGHRWFST